MSSQAAKPAKPAPDFATVSIAVAGTILARMVPNRSTKEIRKYLTPFSLAYAPNDAIVLPSCLRHPTSRRHAHLQCRCVPGPSFAGMTQLSLSSCPGIQSVPASGTRAMAAASTVSATRSSGSRLCTWLLPQARAMVCASSVSTDR